MKITLISDTHTKHRNIGTTKDYRKNNQPLDLPGGDILIHAGDFMNSGYNPTEAMEFFKWFDEIDNYDTKILIAGNHDRWMQDEPEEALGILTGYKTIEYLQDEPCTLYFDGPNGDWPEDNIHIYGSPWQPEFYDWAFNLPRNGEEMKARWDVIPDNTDILITHGPMFGYLDLTLQGIRSGCEFLRERLPDFTDLKMHICGHIHEAYGEHEFVDGKLFLNASVLNRRYEMQNRPIFIEYGNNYSLELGYIIK